MLIQRRNVDGYSTLKLRCCINVECLLGSMSQLQLALPLK